MFLITWLISAPMLARQLESGSDCLLLEPWDRLWKLNYYYFFLDSAQCLPSDFSGSICCQEEKRFVSVPWKHFWCTIMPIWNIRKAVYRESGPRKKVELDEGHPLMSFALLVRQASDRKPFWLGPDLQIPWCLRKRLTEASRTCLWVFLVKSLIPLTRIYWFQNHNFSWTK